MLLQASLCLRVIAQVRRHAACYVCVAMDQHPLLVVEDDPDTREFYETLLTMAGYSVMLAADGRTALARAADTAVAGVILDYRLPDVNDLDLCRWLRATLGAEMAILLVTADHEHLLEARAYAAGATAFLGKPIDPEVLLTLLTAYVDRT